MFRPIKKGAPRNEDTDESAQRNTSAFFGKYEHSELQELLTLSFCSWLAPRDYLRLSPGHPSGLIDEMQGINAQIFILLVPAKPELDLDCREIHQMIRELCFGIYCFNQIPSISLDANYDQSTSCSLPPAYFDTRIGQMLITVDYMLKALWHGAYMPKGKRLRFSEIWRSSMDIDADGNPQTEKNAGAEFCQAGLVDISRNADFQGMFDENLNEDPTYDPNSSEEKTFFMQFVDYMLLKLTFATTEVQQHENVFRFDADYNLSNAIKMTEDHLDTFSYQRLQQRLALQQKLVKKYLEKKVEIRKYIAYLKLISFLIPFIIGLKRKNKVPNLNRLLQPYSDNQNKTERELPPILLGTDFKCQHFVHGQNKYFHLHGGIEFDISTPSVEDVSEDIKSAYDEMHTCVTNHLAQLLDPKAPYRGHYPIPIMNFDGRSYYVIGVELESFNPLCKIQWWGVINEEISILKSKRLPLTDIQAMDQFKKRFGYKKAMKCKSLSFGMKAAAERGLAAIFLTFCRKTSVSSLTSTDETGYGLIHHAAIHNRVAIIYQVLKSPSTMNQRCTMPVSQGKRFQKTETKSAGLSQKDSFGESDVFGPTALHLAAKCGSLEALNFLLNYKADYEIPNERGWMAIHFAAFYDNVACITVLCRKNSELLEAETRSELHSTPLLLAATSGALDTIQYLFSLQANWLKKDNEGNNIIHLAVLNFHTEVLKHLIELHNPDLPVWKTLVGMLNCEAYKRKKMAIQCLEVLCLAKDNYWQCILDAGTIPSLIGLLESGVIKLQCLTAGVLSNISTHDSIARAFVSEAGGLSVLIQLLATNEPELISRCAVILYDVAQLDDNQVAIAELGTIPALVNLLQYDREDLLVNVINCLRVLCTNNKANQLGVKEANGIEPLVQFLYLDSDVLLAVASTAIAELARGNATMQNAFAKAQVIYPLVQLLGGRKISVQVKGAMAIEALSERNAYIQKNFLDMSVTKFLLKLLQAFYLEVKEQGAATLWALAGETLKQQKFMAEQIGYNLIIDMLLSPSARMQCFGGEAVIALSKDSQLHQNQICERNGIAPLVRLLRSGRIAAEEGTLLSIIRALGTLCVGEANISNPVSQENVVDEGALPILVRFLKTHHSLQLKVEAAFSLACIVLKNSNLQKVLQEKEGFAYSDVLGLLYAPDKDVRLRAGYAISLFAYNNPTQQLRILDTGPISLSIFEPFLLSNVETERALAAFQIIVLARIIVDMDQVTLSSRGVSILVELLSSEDTTTLVLTGKLLASVAHTRAGIPEAITSLGTVQRLCYHLYAKDEEVRSAVASALGYLTFNRRAYRHLLVQCRNRPELFERLMVNLSNDARINSEFVKEFRRQKKTGLPSLSLEINRRPPAILPNIRDRSQQIGVKIYKPKLHPKDSLVLLPTAAYLAGRLKPLEKPGIPASGQYPFPHATTSDLIQVSRPRIVNVSNLQTHLSPKKTGAVAKKHSS